MNPSYFVDVQSGNYAGSLPIIARTVWRLHNILRTDPEYFALAFPKHRVGGNRWIGDKVRVFSDQASKLTRTVALLEADSQLKGLLRFHEPRFVPDDFDGEWIEYRRYRVPNRGSRLEKCREYRWNASTKIPAIQIYSQSTKQPFMLFIDAMPGVRPETCRPDSYGLSVVTRRFALPLIK